MDVDHKALEDSSTVRPTDFEGQSTLRNLVAELIFKNELLRSDLLEARDRLGRINALVVSRGPWFSEVDNHEDFVEAPHSLIDRKSKLGAA